MVSCELADLEDLKYPFYSPYTNKLMEEQPLPNYFVHGSNIKRSKNMARSM